MSVNAQDLRSWSRPFREWAIENGASNPLILRYFGGGDGGHATFVDGVNLIGSW